MKLAVLERLEGRSAAALGKGGLVRKGCKRVYDGIEPLRMLDDSPVEVEAMLEERVVALVVRGVFELELTKYSFGVRGGVAKSASVTAPASLLFGRANKSRSMPPLFRLCWL